MSKRPSYPNPFSNWPGTETVREILKPLAEALKDGWPPDLAQRVADCPALPEQFGCHYPSLSKPEQQALLHKLAYETDQGRRDKWRFLRDDFVVRIARPKKPADRLPELYWPEAGRDGLDVNLLRAWFIHAVGGLPTLKQDLLDWLRSRDIEAPDLGKWAERFRINQPWVIDPLDYISRSWRISYGDELENAPPPSSLLWQFFPEGGTDPLATDADVRERCRLTLTFSWFPSMASRVVAEKWSLAKFLTVTQHHFDRVERIFRERGYVRTRETWSPAADRYVQQHCWWLALYQCAGRSLESLAEEYPAEKAHKPRIGSVAFDRDTDRLKTIRSAVTSLAERIGLPLRPE